ncbi:hypothetical protein VT06_15410 [Arsukibacterium sp. MJ3]|uniref:S41 family peptidase n=1 Tax=Arsukibacterium sp. MJ3 TaxID=1632859 RepID=UPI00062733D3|nr:S41 family peptidase [Arsukibacterium sp. MJ3]KKO47758.1 hypothetical protein VT06_15410 [Arsukibacterium sp. MJ3]
MFRQILLILSTVLLTSANVAHAAAPTQHYSLAMLQQDFQQLYQDLQRGSYDLFAHYPKTRYDQSFEQYLVKIDSPMTELQARKHFMQFVALANIAHTRIDLPAAQYRDFVKAGGKTLPFSFNINGADVRVASYFGSSEQVQVGDRVLSINGTAIAAFLQPLQRYVAADNSTLRDRLTEAQLTPLLWLHHGEQDSYSMTLQHQVTGESYSMQQKTLSHTEQAEHSSAHSGEGAKPRQYKIIADNVGYLQPGPFYNIYAATDAEIWDTTEFHSFIDEAFTALLKADVTAIMIDLRGNPGGTNSFSDHMLAWFANKPFRFASDFRIKVSNLSRAANKARMPENAPADAISLQLEHFYAGQKQGEVLSFPLSYSQPHSKERNISATDIQVFILIDRYSYSNAVSVAAIAQDYQFATVIGEPTADLATTYAAMETFTLLHTGLIVGYPKALIIRPNGNTQPAGVTPDIQLPFLADANDSQHSLFQIADYLKKKTGTELGAGQ